MKAARQKRDPSKEPFASPYTDQQRRELGYDDLAAEYERAVRKSEAARQQARGGRQLFTEPDFSDASATATASFAIGCLLEGAWDSVKLREPLKRGGDKRAAQAKGDAAKSYDRICRLAAGLLADVGPREIVARLVELYGVSATTARRALKTDPSGSWANARREKTAT